MNKLLSFKQLSQNLKKTTTNSSNTFKSFYYTLSKSPSIPRKITPNLISPQTLIHHQLHCSSPKSYAFFSNHVVFKHFSSFTHFKGTVNSFSGSGIRMLRSQIPKFKLSTWSSGRNSDWRSWSQGYSADNIVLGLIVANAAVFVLWRVLDPNFMYKNFTIGRYLGPDYLLKLYFAGAVVGSIFYVVHHAFIVKMFQNRGTFGRDPSKVPVLGASGAVNAILLLDIFLFPKATLMFDFFIPVPAILLGIFLIGKDVLRIIEGDPQVSGSVHLGGAVVAAAAWLRLKKGRGFRF